jgi:putative hemolysin
MTPIVIIGFIVLAVLLLGSAFFSSSETALFSLNTLQVKNMRRSHPRRADRLQQLLDSPKQLLSTILIGNTVVNVCASALGFVIAEHFFSHYGEIISIVSITFLLLVLGEVAPKRLAMSKSERLAILYEPVLSVLTRLLKPARVIIESVTGVLEKFLIAGPRVLTEDEFKTVVDVGEEEGVLDQEEHRMVDGIIRLEETQASDVMTPRVDITGIDLDDSLAQNRRIARNVRFRYLPIYRGSLDSPEGFLDVPKYLLEPGNDMASATIPPFFVPETAPLDSLLQTFQKEHRRVAFVTDEFGGTAGLITRGDLLEEIAPDVDNEFGESKSSFKKLREDAWEIDASTSLEDINYELGLELEAEGADRIAGWFIANAERIPRPGETIEAQGCRVTVQRVRRNRILLVLLERLPSANEDDSENGNDD